MLDLLLHDIAWLIMCNVKVNEVFGELCFMLLMCEVVKKIRMSLLTPILASHFTIKILTFPCLKPLFVSILDVNVL